MIGFLKALGIGAIITEGLCTLAGLGGQGIGLIVFGVSRGVAEMIDFFNSPDDEWPHAS